jgi:hypothetical protein
MNKPLNFWKLTGYKAGQNVVCKVVAAELGGYAVKIPKDNLPGFLPTEQKLKIGEEVLAEFVCVDKNRVLLRSRLSGAQVNDVRKSDIKRGDWQNQLEGPMKGAYAGPQSESEMAFQVWAGNKPVNFKLKRAVDLILPPVEGELPEPVKVGDHDLMWLITDLEGGMRTGCMKVFSEEVPSRSAALLYKGRVVGCIYGNKTLSEPQPTEGSLQFMMKDLSLPETNVVIYDLPEQVALSMSALFLGYPVDRTDEHDSKTYFEYIINWLKDREQTACIALSLPTEGGTCLGFVYKGEFIGSFYVEEQKYVTNISSMMQLIEKDPQARIEVSMLPPEMTSTAVRFGYSLSMYMPRS